MTIFVLIGMVFVIICGMLHGRISSASASAAASESCEWIQAEIDVYITLVSIGSNLTHLHGFQLLLLLPKFIEIALFICTNKINLLNLPKSSDRLAIVAKGFLKLPNLIKLIKQTSISLPRNVALGTFSELLIVFST